jgi:IMP dehydrogenase/GMP reductase
MNQLSALRYLLAALVFMLAVSVCNAYPVMNGNVLSNGSEMVTASQPRKKKAKINKPMSAEKAQKQADAKDKKRKQDSEKYIEENRKRSIEIQTPEVQERMKQNVKDANARYKDKKKNSIARTKKAGKKYR